MPLSRLTRRGLLREILEKELYPVLEDPEVTCPECSTSFSTTTYPEKVAADDKAEVIEALINLAEETYPKQEL